MKNKFILLAFLVSAINLFAQVPQSFSYQAVARNAAGQPLTEQIIGLRFSIIDGSNNLLYWETHTPTTNELGLFTLSIGGGDPQGGNFESINWADGSMTLRVEIDPEGGDNYTLDGTTYLESVPFALYAKQAPPSGNAEGDLSGDYPAPTVAGLQNRPISSATPAVGDALRWDGTVWAPASDTTISQGSWMANGADISNNNIGYVGIGTSTPAVKLHLRNSILNAEAFRIDGYNTWMAFYDGDFYDGFLWNNLGNIALGTSHLNPSGRLRFYTYGQERITILSSGQTGIGITSPLYRLHVEDGGIAIHGKSISNYGLYGYSNSQIGIYGYSNSLGSAGIFGQSAYIGVEGITNANSTDNGRQGVRGDNHGSATGWAGYFFGNVGVSGTLSKGAGSFKIDHPLDPENKYLYHSFVESPDMKNIYDGVVTTDAQGFAMVVLPEWFDALNKDFCYQLTVVGTFAQAIVSQKIENNRFQIQTSQPQVEVCWQITGIRKDPFAEQNRIPVEENKPADKRGKYLHPQAYGKPLEQAVDYLPKLIIPEN